MRMRSALLLLSIAVAAAPLEAMPVSRFVAEEVIQFALRGTVKDRHGKAVPGATVVAMLGESKSSVVTDANGVFRFSLPAGTYRVSVAVPGFATTNRSDVTVGPGQAADLTIIVGFPAGARDRVGATPPITIAPPPPPVVAYDTAPPPPLPSPPQPAPVPAADGHPASSGVYWNEWLEGPDQRISSVPLPPAGEAASMVQPTRLVIDLSLVDLSRLDSANVTSSSSTADLTSALAGETRITVMPVVIGDALALESASAKWQKLRIDVDKMKTTSVSFPTAPSIDDATFRNVAKSASLLGGSRWSPLILEVHGVRKGCSGLALSVWDENLRRPLDQQFFAVSVGDARCGEKTIGTTDLSTALLRRYGSASGDYDAALHVFEMQILGTNVVVTSAVFVARGGPRPRVWRLGRQLSTLREAIAPDLGFARASQPYAVGMASRTMMTELFPDDPDAQSALGALKQFRNAPGKTIYARIITADGRNLPLPLGLIDVGGGVPLGSIATIATPFPLDTAGVSRAACINQRVIVSDSPEFAGIRPYPSGEPLVGYSKASEYFRGATADSVALVLLGHHGETEQLVFDPLTPKIPMTPGFLTRKFDHGVGFFMVCGLAAPSAVPTTWLETFGDHGIDAAIASPFEIEADTAEQFLTAVQEVLAATPAASSITLADLYTAAINHMAPDKRYEAFEYVVIGDGSIRLCGEGS